MNSPFPTGTVTFLFTDIEGSTPLWEKMPQDMREAVAQHHEILNRAIEDHDGKVFQILGDAFQAAFRFPADGLQAALSAQRNLQAANWGPTGPLKVRMGLHIGPAEIEQRDGPWGGQYAVSHTLNRSARVMSAGHGGQILLSEEAAQLVKHTLPEGVHLKDLGLQRLKGMVQLEQVYQVTALDLPQEFPPLASSVIQPHNLPTRLNSFIGRSGEIDQLYDRLSRSDVRLLTITGVGGTGKTTLAIQAGFRLLDLFPDGVFFVDLTAVKETQFVVSMIAQVLSMHELPGKTIDVVLKEYLAKRQLLLILDNFEHVIGAGPDIVQLLETAPRVKVLITSREPLLVRPEHHYSLSPLPLPSKQSELAELEKNDAVRLFLDRASLVKPGLALTLENAPAIVDICQRLDGLPLAIELVAPHVRFLGPIQLRDQLNHRLRLLASSWRDLVPRHQTMRAAITWSYDLLSEDEKTLFRRLAVFPGSFHLEACEAICGGNALNVVFGLEWLVNKHLVNLREQDPGPRFWLFETLREYALELSVAGGEFEDLRRGHAEYYTQLANNQPGQSYSLWELEMDNLRAAMDWAITAGATDTGLRLSANFFIWEKTVSEGRLLINRVLSLPDAHQPTKALAAALYSAAVLAFFQRDIPGCLTASNEMAEVGRSINDPHKVWSSEFIYGSILIMRGEYRKAIEQILACRAEDPANFLDFTLCSENLAVCELLLGNLLEAKGFIQDAHTSLEKLGEWAFPYRIDTLSIQGFIAIEEKDFREALRFFEQAFQLTLQIDTQQRLGIIYAGLSQVALLTGDGISSVYWMSFAETIARNTGFNSRLIMDRLIERYTRDLQVMVGPAAFQSAWDAAQSLDLKQAVEFGREHLATMQNSPLPKEFTDHPVEL